MTAQALPMVACVDCEFAAMRTTRTSMLRLGFTNCARKEKHRFEGLERLQACPTFRPAPDGQGATRREWLRKQGIFPR